MCEIREISFKYTWDRKSRHFQIVLQGSSIVVFNFCTVKSRQLEPNREKKNKDCAGEINKPLGAYQEKTEEVDGISPKEITKVLKSTN